MQLFPTGSYPVRQRLLSEPANHGAFVKKNTVNFEKSVNSIDKQGKTGYHILAY